MFRLAAALLLSALLVLVAPTPAGAAPPPAGGGGWSVPDAAVTTPARIVVSTESGEARIPSRETWRWPVSPVRIVSPYVAPPHAYGAGHRGIDLAADGEVRAPASGTVAFAGVVVDRPLLTIDHGDGLVTTLEPVTTDLSPGDAVSRGDVVGRVAVGGHTPAGAVHFGVRLQGAYVNPLLLLGGVPRAVLLPCC
ncbi:murein hydrolase activator EnvC [Microbacterium sp. Marseille-Q6965]|uniref:murein hydrolase activator EnvC family protein n=1 Tax=Microbacterium sp. Marseille-Q6965 TaxID=2965072 RepID=UPI0021B75F4C|nr:M23 family metallopeptidase [Microbacterium sp. Marseille-Q6965]